MINRNSDSHFSKETFSFFHTSFFLFLKSTMATATMMAADAGDLPDWLDAEDVLGGDDDGAFLSKRRRKKRESIVRL